MEPTSIREVHAQTTDPKSCGCWSCRNVLKMREQFAQILIKRLKEVDHIKWKEPRA